MNHPRILSIGTANPTVRLTQEQGFHAAGYQGERMRKIFLSSAAAQQANRRYPQIIDFETFIDREQIDEVGLQHRDGKLRIVLGASVQQLSGPMLEMALQQLLQRHGLSRSRIDGLRGSDGLRLRGNLFHRRHRMMPRMMPR